LELEPANANLKSGLEQAEARIRPDSPPSLVDDEAQTVPRSAPEAGGMPDLSGMADMLGGGGGGGGGMPDLAGLMSNPAIMQMAQSMMANGGMERLMQNPALAGMVCVSHNGLNDPY
jgi:small glutamine-rich tetratricopeptide repeat-containing protein alpha